jgi:tripartite-type tricarboxylate transporter receptor subunit TctC
MKLLQQSAVALCGLAAFLQASPASSQAADNFYQGRQIKLIVGTSLGGSSFGARARLVQRFMGEDIPGKPSFVLQAISGASGVGAANYLYSAPKDGATIATFNSALPFYQAMGQSNINFDANKFSWIGSIGRVVSVVTVWHTHGIRTIKDAQEKEVILGATGVAGTSAMYPALLNNLFHTKFKIITGYESSANNNLAMESGEVQGVGGPFWTSFKTDKPDWIRDGKIVPLVQMNVKKDPDLPDVPLVSDLAENDEQREILRFILANTGYEYPYAGTPGMPANRLAMLRAAFRKMLENPEFLAAAEKQGIEIEPLTGEELTKVVAGILATPPHIVAKAKELMTVKSEYKKTGN